MIFLDRRDLGLTELMDDPACDPEALRRTYAQFRVVNRLVAGWGRVYRRQIRPLLTPDRPTTVLDLGCGGGDVARQLAGWAARDGLSLVITAIDPDERAYAFATSRPTTPGVSFRRAGSADLVAEGASFDLVVSNHVLHHLGPAELAGVLADSERLVRRRVIHSDIERGRFAFVGYGVLARPFGRRSFISTDGLRSIRRSYRAGELRAAVPAGWRVQRQFPARLLLVADGPASETIGS